LNGAVLLSAVAALTPDAAAQVAASPTLLPELRKALYGGVVEALDTLPNPSGGAFTYRFDPALGVFTRVTEDLGPLFADRADTTGRGQVTLTGSYSFYHFDNVDGVNLHDRGLSSQAILAIASEGTRVSFLDFREDVDLDIFTVGALYGVTEQLDVGLVLPIVHARVKEQPQRFGFRDCRTPVAPDLSNCGPVIIRRDNLRSNDAENTGVGDLILRGKYKFWEYQGEASRRLAAAAVLDVKLPSGDTGQRKAFEQPAIFVGGSQRVSDTILQLGEPPLGTGIVRVKPQLVVSGSWFGVSPHINVGAELGTTEGVTNDFVYTVGAEYTVLGRVTLLADLIGRHAFDVKRGKLVVGGVEGTADPDTLSASFGVKVNPIQRLVVFVNVLIPVNDTGLRADVAPTFGLEWSF
jgi:hypothetical protein